MLAISISNRNLQNVCFWDKRNRPEYVLAPINRLYLIFIFPFYKSNWKSRTKFVRYNQIVLLHDGICNAMLAAMVAYVFHCASTPFNDYNYRKKIFCISSFSIWPPYHQSTHHLPLCTSHTTIHPSPQHPLNAASTCIMKDKRRHTHTLLQTPTTVFLHSSPSFAIRLCFICTAASSFLNAACLPDHQNSPPRPTLFVPSTNQYVIKVNNLYQHQSLLYYFSVVRIAVFSFLNL